MGAADLGPERNSWYTYRRVHLCYRQHWPPWRPPVQSCVQLYHTGVEVMQFPQWWPYRVGQWKRLLVNLTQRRPSGININLIMSGIDSLTLFKLIGGKYIIIAYPVGDRADLETPCGTLRALRARSRTSVLWTTKCHYGRYCGFGITSDTLLSVMQLR